jgi:hypothetical protein
MVVTVECPGLNPCCEGAVVRDPKVYGSTRRSRILAARQRREIGRYDEPWFPGSPCLRIGIVIELFQMDGKEAVETEMLKMWVRNWRPRGPRCLR